MQNDSALVSASSDISVKIWRPHAEERTPPQTIGLHGDYVKCLASPGRNATWVASGSLDRKVCLWDINGNGRSMQISVADQEAPDKGSVYALAATQSTIVTGGPENVVKVWDARSARRITRFVGHTDNIRSILISQDGDTIMTASSDRTVRVWSMTAGRCQATLSTHSDSVWCLASNHPKLSIFYSGDRSGIVAKTDARGMSEWDDALTVAICQEHEGVSKIVCADDYIWTATASSSINRWADIDTALGIQAPERQPQLTTNARRKVSTASSTSQPTTNNALSQNRIPMNCVMRLPNTFRFPFAQLGNDRIYHHSSVSGRKSSALAAPVESDFGIVIPLRELPEETIEGQNGLIKHIMLNDRRRVLTLDTAGEVMMWDLLQVCRLFVIRRQSANSSQCIPIKSFGKRHLEDVEPEVNTAESVANWCTVDTRIGNLTCVLEGNYCFDAEVYADMLKEAESIEFREDQRSKCPRILHLYQAELH